MKKLLLSSAALVLATASPASAATFMLKGSNNNTQISSFLTSQGHTVVANSSDYTGVDAVILLRTIGDPNLVNYVLGGGTLVTEWIGADWAMSNLLGGAVLSGFAGSGIGFNTPVTFTAEGIAAGLGNGVGNSYSAGDASQFFRTFSDIGTGSVLATRPGGVAAIVGGNAGSGYVVANGIDWADFFATSGSANRQVLLNSLSIRGNVSGAVPEPATWAMMLLGFGFVGGAIRFTKRRQRLTLSYS